MKTKKTKRLTNAQRAILLEAARRYLHHLDRDILQESTGLGSATQYKPVLDADLMVHSGNPRPRRLAWFKLTKKGALIVKHWIDGGLTVNMIDHVFSWHTFGSKDSDLHAIRNVATMLLQEGDEE